MFPILYLLTSRYVLKALLHSGLQTNIRYGTPSQQQTG
ncbi:hypothetical protein HMPREF9303_0270 [Prevotella denticola CRIS 18C-A]|uniref:Uncharacterized protein n=1 Tax=Prevotella denticola CRIS 18C-A TaxID=944557 RepID=F0H5I3_9BACT|nr:hypothetical protein HMPREF9303_0270 [Prevotella denticola CRIS 18C-A]